MDVTQFSCLRGTEKTYGLVSFEFEVDRLIELESGSRERSRARDDARSTREIIIARTRRRRRASHRRAPAPRASTSASFDGADPIPRHRPRSPRVRRRRDATRAQIIDSRDAPFEHASELHLSRHVARRTRRVEADVVARAIHPVARAGDRDGPCV